MAERVPAVDAPLRRFIEKRRIFFAAGAAPRARVNASPRPAESLRVLDAGEVVHLGRTCSGNAAAAHLRATTARP